MSTIEELLAELRRRHAGHDDLLRPERAWCCTEELVLAHGNAWIPTHLADGLKQGDRGRCFGNAYDLVARHERVFRYVEGFGLGPTRGEAEPHAWAANAAREVVDPTWNPHGAAYYGIELPVDLVALSRLVRRPSELSALFDDKDFEDLCPLLKVKPWSVEAAYVHLELLRRQRLAADD